LQSLFCTRSILKNPKKVLVIGAGVAGLEVARVAKGLRRQVEIWERSSLLGGQLKYAVAAPDEEEVRAVWDYRWQEIEMLNVPIRTNFEPTLARILDYAPDRVISRNRCY
jgi:NADPH-dependent glutamate synthase beta subunit-like oxidoreductase